MTEPFRILVVCDTNVCRSPLAERHLRHQFDSMLGTAGDGVEVSSAGVRAVIGSPMDSHAAAELERIGGSASFFEARQLTPAMLQEADLVLTATRALRSRVLEDDPAALRRTLQPSGVRCSVRDVAVRPLAPHLRRGGGCLPMGRRREQLRPRRPRRRLSPQAP